MEGAERGEILLPPREGFEKGTAWNGSDESQHRKMELPQPGSQAAKGELPASAEQTNSRAASSQSLLKF